jgi:hypothetical protein
LETVRVTLEYIRPPDLTFSRRDLELPAEIPVGQLLRGLTIALELLEPAAAEQAADLPYQLVRAAGGEPLASDKNLKRCRVVAGERLRLLSTASLIAPGGQKFLLTGNRTRIGRPDGTGEALIDLSHEPDSSSVHRTHAFIGRERGAWLFTVDRQATNRTQVNGRDLRPGQAVPLKNGDQLRLGKVKLRFICG